MKLEQTVGKQRELREVPTNVPAIGRTSRLRQVLLATFTMLYLIFQSRYIWWRVLQQFRIRLSRILHCFLFLFFFFFFFLLLLLFFFCFWFQSSFNLIEKKKWLHKQLLWVIGMVGWKWNIWMSDGGIREQSSSSAMAVACFFFFIFIYIYLSIGNSGTWYCLFIKF